MSDEHDVLVHIRYIRESVDGINVRLDTLNGRTRKVETDMAVMHDRMDRSRVDSTKWGGVAGAIIAGGIAAWTWLTTP